MRFIVLLLLLALCAPSLLRAGDAKDKPRVVELVRPLSSELPPEWLAAVERLRMLPRAGEIKCADTAITLQSLYELPAADADKLNAHAANYDAELVKLAGKWLDEAKALRAAHEVKMAQALPEAKREAAQKVLDFSHARWVTPHDREAKFRQEYAERTTKVRESKLKMSAEEFEAARGKLQQWVKEEREKYRKEDADLLTQTRALLSPSEAARWDQLIRKPQEPAPVPGAERK